MKAKIHLPLFGKQWAGSNGPTNNGRREVLRLGSLLRARLYEYASVLEKLTDAGWAAVTCLDGIDLTNRKVTTIDGAKAELDRLRIDPTQVRIEWVKE